MINLELKKNHILYDGKVKTTYNGQGLVRLKDKYLGERAYVIFPINRKDTGESLIVSVDEILNKGIHPNNSHTTRVLLGKEYVGRKCLITLQDN